MSRIFGVALAFVVSFAGITAADAASKIQAITSPGGIKAWLVSEPSVPIVALDYAFKGGGNADPAGKPAVATMLAALLDEGAGELDARAFQERLEEKAIQLGFSASRDHFRGSMHTLSANLDEAVNLTRLALTAPRFDEEPVERIRDQLQAQLVEKQHQPERHREPPLVGDGLPWASLWHAGQRYAGIACRHYGGRSERIRAQHLRARHADHRYRRRSRCRDRR